MEQALLCWAQFWNFMLFIRWSWKFEKNQFTCILQCSLSRGWHVNVEGGNCLLPHYEDVISYSLIYLESTMSSSPFDECVFPTVHCEGAWLTCLGVSPKREWMCCFGVTTADLFNSRQSHIQVCKVSVAGYVFIITLWGADESLRLYFRWESVISWPLAWRASW